VIVDESTEACDDHEKECEESSNANKGPTQQVDVKHTTTMALVVGHLL
jgi:hypothetical protein